MRSRDRGAASLKFIQISDALFVRSNPNPTHPPFSSPPNPYPFLAESLSFLQAIMSAIDGWVEDVEDALSKAESSYRQITEDTDAGEKRMLLTESKNLVVFIFHTYQVDE